MKKLKIYLDTSVICYHFAFDTPEKRSVTIEYFNEYVKPGVYEHYISDFVIAEIARTKDPLKRKGFFDIIEKYGLSFLPVEPEKEIRELAAHYIVSRVIPEKKVDDALHVSLCTIHKIDILLSWNYRHLANVNKERGITIANLEAGYAFAPRLANPMEVFND